MKIVFSRFCGIKECAFLCNGEFQGISYYTKKTPLSVFADKSVFYSMFRFLFLAPGCSFPHGTCQSERRRRHILLQTRPLQSLKQRLSRFLITRFAKQCKHIFLIALYARLVERIDAQKVSTDAAGKFEEIEELS